MLNEFKNFIAKGNVMDMAVGIIIGAAFTAIVTSLVGDILMPIVGMVVSGADFSNLFFTMDGQTYESMAAAEAAGATIIRYGAFINAIINFIVVAFVIFMLVRQINKLKAKEAAAPSTPSADVVLLGEIRDLLKKK